jgi:hypothetical protein
MKRKKQTNKMKKLLLFLLSLLGSNLFSQEILQPTDEKSYIEYKDKVLESLIQNDASLCKNNILYDRVFPMANLSIFNNQDTIKSSNYNHFTRSLSELYEASIIPQTDVLSLQQIDDIAYHFEREGQIQIGIINMDFSMIDTTSLNTENPKLRIVNQKFERIESKDPFIHKKALVIAPIAKDIIYGENIVFEFGNILVQKAANSIKELTAIFENNQIYTIYENGTLINDRITVNFQESGIKEIGFNVTFSDGTSLTTFSNFNIQVTPPNAQGVVSFWSTDPFQGYFEPSDCNGTCYGKGEYKVYYNPNGNNEIMKPIIITDGFDPGDKRKIDGLVVGNSDYKMVAGFNGALQYPKPETIYNMMYEYGSTETTDPNFINQLHALGFDVILLSFPKYIRKTINHLGHSINLYRDGGSDYFERDAQVVKQLIRIVNNQLTENNSNEKIKLIAPSGAALLARIALVEMEQNGENHNVDLFVSFDGPHLGANVPIGLQKAAVYFGLSYLDNTGLNPLNNPWSKQSVLNHYLAGTSYPSGVSGYRDVFQSKMDNLGFPQQCRNIAFNNGSSGTPHATPGDNMFYMYFKYWLGSSQKREIWLNFDSNSGSNSVFRWKKSHWRWLSTNPRWITDLDINRYNNTYSNYGSLDTSPGSYLDIIHRTYKNSHATFPLYYYDGDTNYPFGDYYWVPIVLSWFTNFDIYMDLKEDAVFMPSKSTLAYNGSNKSWNEDLGCRNLVCTGETPFDSYYTLPINQAHVSVHANSVAWLLQELQGIEMEPVYSCYEGLALEGCNVLCYNPVSSCTYEIEPYNDNISTIWIVTPNLTIVDYNDEEIKVRRNTPNDHTPASITATLSNCNILTKVITCPDYNRFFDVKYDEPNLYVKVSLDDVSNSIPLSEQNITDVQWAITTGNAQIVNYNQLFAEIDGTEFTGTVTVKSDNEIITKPFFWPDPAKCKAIMKVGTDKYQVIDRCNNNEILTTLAEKELYSAYGYKLGDLPLINQEMEINNGNSGDIQLIRVNTGEEELTKRVIKD